jgi:hypothetical protein
LSAQKKQRSFLPLIQIFNLEPQRQISLIDTADREQLWFVAIDKDDLKLLYRTHEAIRGLL